MLQHDTRGFRDTDKENKLGFEENQEDDTYHMITESKLQVKDEDHN